MKVVNEEKEYFKNTNEWKPRSLKGKILQFKGYLSGFWWQYRDTFSNMNIFSSLMSVEDMVTRTLGGDTCDTPGDYLRYEQYTVLLNSDQEKKILQPKPIPTIQCYYNA